MRSMAWILFLALAMGPGCIPFDQGNRDEEDFCPASMPENGSFCERALTCTWGPEACQCGTCNPAFGCQCVGGSWICWHTDPMPCTDAIEDAPQEASQDTEADVPQDGQADAQPEAIADVPAECPSTMPGDGESCLGTAACTWGPDACQCGLPCHPAFGCDCVDGAWRCWHTDPMECEDTPTDVSSADVPGDILSPDVFEETPAPDAWEDVPDVFDIPPDCPVEPAIGVLGACGETRTCEYGQECCCGNCYAEMVCRCDGERWSCYATDSCMIPGCPDGIEDVEDVEDVPPLIDVPVDVPPDATFDTRPPACCAKNADCGPGWACGGSGGSPTGSCKPEVPFGECWSLEDCPTGSTCLGAFVCPCDADCDAPDQSGTCVPLPAACCWVDTDCDAGQVCRSQGGVNGLPGACVDDPGGPACLGDIACCWNDGDCPDGLGCKDARACGCIALCPLCGACAPDQMGTCG